MIEKNIEVLSLLLLCEDEEVINGAFCFDIEACGREYCIISVIADGCTGSYAMDRFIGKQI